MPSKSRQEIIQSMRGMEEPVTQNAVPDAPITEEAAAVPETLDTAPISDAQVAPPSPAEPKVPTESERYFQSKADKLQALVEQQAQQVAQLTGQLATLQDHLLRSQQQAQQEAPTPTQLDWSDPAQVKAYLKQVNSETLTKDLNYDPSLQDKVKLFFDVQEFRVARPDSVNYDPIFEQAFKYLDLPKNKEGFERVYKFITEGLVPLAQRVAAKPEGVKGANVKQQTRTMSPEAAQAAQEAAAKLRSSNQTGVATNDMPSKNLKFGGVSRKDFIKGVLEKTQSI